MLLIIYYIYQDTGLLWLSAARHQLTIPRHRLSTYGPRAFAVAGPTMFNTLPDDLRDPAVSTPTFRQSLKTHLFSAYQHG